MSEEQNVSPVTGDPLPEPPRQKVRFATIRDSAPAELGIPDHLLAGAARFHGWNDDTEITPQKARDGVAAWLSRPVDSDEETR